MVELGKLMHEIVAMYGNDPCSPSVTMSFIVRRHEYYASVVRYRERLGMGKDVVCKAAHETLEGAVALLAQKWRAATAEREPDAALERADDCDGSVPRDG